MRGVRGGGNRPLVVQNRLLVTTGITLHEVRADDSVGSVLSQKIPSSSRNANLAG